MMDTSHLRILTVGTSGAARAGGGNSPVKSQPTDAEAGLPPVEAAKAPKGLFFEEPYLQLGDAPALARTSGIAISLNYLFLNGCGCKLEEAIKN